MDEDRKCFRLIGGVLCEQTVKAVLPQLNTNKEQLEKLIENGKDQLGKKGVEINEFKQKYDIRVKGADDKPGPETVKESSSKPQNVLAV